MIFLNKLYSCKTAANDLNTTSPPGTFGRGAKTQYVCIITNFTSNYKSAEKKKGGH